MNARSMAARASIALATVQILAGCGANVAQPAGTLLSAAATAQVRPALLYVSEPAVHSVSIYSYPGLRPQARLTGLRNPFGMCTDVRNGDVWIVDGAFANKVVAFAHGATKPFRSVKVPAGYYPNACAVDSVSGDLAVTALFDNDDPGSLLVYRGARGTPAAYQAKGMFIYDFVTYDDGGNAFVDGNDFDGRLRLAELLAGSSELSVVGPKGSNLRKVGNIQYDGSDLAVGSEKSGVIYRIAGGAITGETTLSGTCFVQQFYIDGSHVIAPNSCGSQSDVLVYDYPGGGSPVKTLSNVGAPFGVVVSR